MRNKVVRKLRMLAYLASEEIDKERQGGSSKLLRQADGSVAWSGFRRIFRDMKRAYQKGVRV
jgi:hypothetical protein